MLSYLKKGLVKLGIINQTVHVLVLGFKYLFIKDFQIQENLH